MYWLPLLLAAYVAKTRKKIILDNYDKLILIHVLVLFLSRKTYVAIQSILVDKCNE